MRLAQQVFIDTENMGLRAHVAFPAAASRGVRVVGRAAYKD
ncbi:hypothetical protein [Burkholderia dolosa]|nr:hypothetical protein [Burkholderia dolosa]